MENGSYYKPASFFVILSVFEPFQNKLDRWVVFSQVWWYVGGGNIGTAKRTQKDDQGECGYWYPILNTILMTQ